MSLRFVGVVMVVVVCGAGCGSKAKSQHSDRNDALNETQGQASSVSVTNTASTNRASTNTASTNTASRDTGSQPAPTATAPGTEEPTATTVTTTLAEHSADVNSSGQTTGGTASHAVDGASSSSAEVGSDSQAAGGKACGGRAGDTCEPTEYCAYAPGQLCGRADAQATCKPRPESCTREYAPVCGCDGKTYATNCVAASEGVGVFEEGECAASEPEPAECETIQCFRAITCAESCSSEIVQAGCCPCPDGLIDTFIECTDAATPQ